MNEIRVSIILPVYNGALYLAHQLDSIIPMLAKNDEIVISYDQSTDDTLKIVKEYELKNSRISVFINNGERGVWQNSINALNHARGKYILPCDQDDEWINNKINIMVSALENSGAVVATHDGYVCDANLNIIPPSIFDRCNTNGSLVRNFLKNSVSGCCLAYRSEIKGIFSNTPFTPDASDQWAALGAIVIGKLEIVHDKLIKHRIHDSNYTPKRKRKMRTILWGRFLLTCNLVWLLFHRKEYQISCGSKC